MRYRMFNGYRNGYKRTVDRVPRIWLDSGWSGMTMRRDLAYPNRAKRLTFEINMGLYHRREEAARYEW